MASLRVFLLLPLCLRVSAVTPTPVFTEAFIQYASKDTSDGAVAAGGALDPSALPCDPFTEGWPVLRRWACVLEIFLAQQPDGDGGLNKVLTDNGVYALLEGIKDESVPLTSISWDNILQTATLIGESINIQDLMQDFGAFLAAFDFDLAPDWPYAFPYTLGNSTDQTCGPWPAAGELSLTKLFEMLGRAGQFTGTSTFTKSPLIGSASLSDGTVVPFPHSIQDAEGIGIVGTADLAAVRAAVPRPWVPVQTNAVGGVLKAVWSTWKDIEHVNYLGEEGRDCQRQWIVFHVMHEDDPRANTTIESPIQTLYAQFAGQHIHYLYNWKMYTDCHSDKMVRVDRELYGWDSEPATHDYQRDKKGNLDWTVRDGAGNQLMKLHASMPYGVPNLLRQLPGLIKYGTAVGNPSTDLVPDRKAFQRFLTRDDLPFHWITKPGILDIPYSSTMMPVIYSPFSQWDVPKYPSTSAGNQWDSIHYSDEAYYPETGPFGVNSPMPETDYVDFTGNADLQDFGMELTPDFSLVFYAYHFRMQWEAPWTFVPVKTD